MKFRLWLSVATVILASLLVRDATGAESVAPSALSEVRRVLARHILENRDLDEVARLGQQMFRDRLNAGSNYTEVWIRDFETFIETALESAQAGGNPRRALGVLPLSGRWRRHHRRLRAEGKGAETVPPALVGHQAGVRRAREHSRGRPGAGPSFGDLEICEDHRRYIPPAKERERPDGLASAGARTGLSPEKPLRLEARADLGGDEDQLDGRAARAPLGRRNGRGEPSLAEHLRQRDVCSCGRPLPRPCRPAASYAGQVAARPRIRSPPRPWNGSGIPRGTNSGRTFI